MNFSTKGVEVKDGGSSVSKFLGYGVQKAAIIGYEIKKASTGNKQVILLMESPKVTEAGFEPDPSAKFGGKVGRVQFSGFLNSEKNFKEFLGNVAIVAKKFDVSEKVDAIESSDIDDYMSKLIVHLRGKYAVWAICAEEYLSGDKVKYFLKMRRFGFIATLDEYAANPEHIKPFDKNNVYDYSPVAQPSENGAPLEPNFKEQNPEDEIPW